MEKITAKNGVKNPLPPTKLSNNEYKLKTFRFSLNLLVHILIGFVVGASLLYAFRAGLPVGSTPIHIVLCVIGYQLLMAESILSLSPYNSWSAHLRLVDKRRAHWVLQILGSGMAIAGSVIKSIDKSTNWTSLHGKYALVAMVFTTVSLVNGVASLYAYEVRKVVPIPGLLSKLTHICFGSIAFGSGTIALCYGFNKNGVRNFLGQGNADTLIAFSVIFTLIVLISPVVTFGKRVAGK